MKAGACVLVLLPWCCTAFLYPQVSSSGLQSCSVARKRPRNEALVRMQAAAASGFKFSYGDAEVPRLLDTLQQKKSWEQEYKAYIKRNGKQICAMSWRGYETYGRGAIFAKYDLNDDKTSNPEVDLRAAIPSMYVELSRWQESGKEPAAGGDLTNLQHIIERLQSYDPEKQFVVVFQSHGLMGADVVTPNIPPHEMSALLKAEEEHSADIAQGIIDVQASS